MNDIQDADRWRHCVKHGFPVLSAELHSARRKQTSTPGHAWVAFRVVSGLDFIHYGDTATEAVDSAIAADTSNAGTADEAEGVKP